LDGNSGAAQFITQTDGAVTRGNHGFLKHAARLPQAADGMASACAWLQQIQSASAARGHQNKPSRLGA
jgi:hypothetical protein